MPKRAERTLRPQGARLIRFAAAALVTLAVCGSLWSSARAGTADKMRTARRVFLENMQAGRYDRLSEIYAANFVAHGPGVDYTLAQDTAATKSWLTAMPDLHVTIGRTVAEGDLVAVHWRAAGTNTVAVGEMPGKGARLGVEGFFRFVGGRIVEEWSVIDIATLRKRLGADDRF